MLSNQRHGAKSIEIRNPDTGTMGLVVQLVHRRASRPLYRVLAAREIDVWQFNAAAKTGVTHHKLDCIYYR